MVYESEVKSDLTDQCWECLRRETYCDGSHPFCCVCQSAGIVCPGYGDQRPLVWVPTGKVTRFRRKKKNAAIEELESFNVSLHKPERKGNDGAVGSETRTKIKVKPLTQRGRGRPSKKPYSGSILVLTLNESSDSETTETIKSEDTHSTKTNTTNISGRSDVESQPLQIETSSITKRSLTNHDQTYTFTGKQPSLDPLQSSVWDADPWAVLIPQDLRPQEWDFIEALRFHEQVFSVYQPKALIPSLLTYPLTADMLAQIKPSNRPSFISTAISFQLAITCGRNRIHSPSSSSPVGRLWETYFHYVGLSIQSVNEDLARGVVAKGDVLWGINGLLHSELILSQSTNWRPHARGFISFINLCGGLHSLLDCFYDVTVPLLSFVITCTLANTTSPCYDQIAQVTLFDDKDLQNLYSVASYPSFPYPVELFLAVVRINRIRLQMGNLIILTDLQPQIDAVLDEIQEFNPESWIERCDLPSSYSKLAIAADIFQSSVALYGMLSLLLSNSLQLSPFRKELMSFHYSRLLLNIDLAMQTLDGTDILIWPLIVAGVASQSPNQQAVITKYLSTIERDPLHIRSAGGAKDVLSRFWVSGKTSWDDCFDRSCFFLS